MIPTFSFDRVVDGDPVGGEVSFLRAGQEIAVYDFNESDLALTNGSIVPNSLSLVRPGVYSFQLALDNFNQDAVLSIAQGCLRMIPATPSPMRRLRSRSAKCIGPLPERRICLPGGRLIRILSILRPQRVRPRVPILRAFTMRKSLPMGGLVMVSGSTKTKPTPA